MRNPPFSEEEDAILTELVAAYGESGQWRAIRQQMLHRLPQHPARYARHYRERWWAIDPELCRAPVSEEEATIIMDEQKKIGNAWSTIAEKLPTKRTSNQVKNFFYSRLRSTKRKGSEDDEQIHRDHPEFQRQRSAGHFGALAMADPHSKTAAGGHVSALEQRARHMTLPASDPRLEAMRNAAFQQLIQQHQAHQRQQQQKEQQQQQLLIEARNQELLRQHVLQQQKQQEVDLIMRLQLQSMGQRFSGQTAPHTQQEYRGTHSTTPHAWAGQRMMGQHSITAPVRVGGLYHCSQSVWDTPDRRQAAADNRWMTHSTALPGIATLPAQRPHLQLPTMQSLLTGARGTEVSVAHPPACQKNSDEERASRLSGLELLADAASPVESASSTGHASSAASPMDSKSSPSMDVLAAVLQAAGVIPSTADLSTTEARGKALMTALEVMQQSASRAAPAPSTAQQEPVRSADHTQPTLAAASAPSTAFSLATTGLRAVGSSSLFSTGASQTPIPKHVEKQKAMLQGPAVHAPTAVGGAGPAQVTM